MIRDHFVCKVPRDLALSIVVLGASGDLAKKKTFPALFALYSKGFLPRRTQIVGYARSQMTHTELAEHIRPFLKGDSGEVEKFISFITYVQGEYHPDSPGYERMMQHVEQWEHQPMAPAGRLFYLALPPYVYPEACGGIARCCRLPEESHPSSWLRVIVEKPFGMDTATSEELSEQLGKLFPEEELYRIDHYLGKELTQNLLVMRFANPIFHSWWNRFYISNVQISFKEDFGTQGRGGYFDKYGIIRDVIQNHLSQVLALVAMEQPVSSHPDDIRDEKCKLLRSISPVTKDNCLLGQYTAANGNPGYKDDEGVPDDSRTPTYAALRLFINNDRWAGVPFVLRAGKAMNEKGVIVRIQLRGGKTPLFGNIDLEQQRDEFVMRLQPGEAIYAKIIVKRPGLDMDVEMSELDLSYKDRYNTVNIPDAYERLILDCIRGDQQHFVRRDELRAAWKIFTPLLHAIDEGEVPTECYPFGSRGPPSHDAFMKASDYVRTRGYVWRPAALTKGNLASMDDADGHQLPTLAETGSTGSEEVVSTASKI